MSEQGKKRLKEVLEWIGCIIIAIILALLVRYYIGTPTIVQQPSMFPTLKQDQRLILNRWSRTIHQMPKRGEIITFEAPTKSYISSAEADFNNPVAIYENQPEGIFKKFRYYVLEIGKTSYIKRAIGLPGEHIKIDNGKVYINGDELQEEYLQSNVITEGGPFVDIIVPEGYIFAMGDNRAQSTDSRRFGCIPLEKIESKLLFRFWPLNVWGKVK
ncbi:MAG: signal peptidase I [Clostridia bacterium]|nr:signal peptidase I [Clostridia bacterium]